MASTVSVTQADEEAVLELYEFEACPYCGRVRRALRRLDLSYRCRSSARGSVKRALLEGLGGKVQLPFLVDPSARCQLYESADIIAHLEQRFGRPRSLVDKLVSPIAGFWGAAAGLAVAGGQRVRVARRAQPAALPELLIIEDGAAAASVRAALCELDLDYLVHDSAGRERRQREAGLPADAAALVQLIDADAEATLTGAEAVIAHLEERYG